jgi:hypothetical protein
MTHMSLHEIEDEESPKLPLTEPEVAPNLFLSGVEVEVRPGLGVAESIDWQDCSMGSGGRYDCERRIVVRMVLPTPVAVALHRKLGEGLSRPRRGIVAN